MALIQNLASMDVEGMIQMIRSSFGMMMEEEMMMEIEEVLRSFDWGLLSSFVDNFTGLIK